jgi:hypothetical protein
MAMGAFPQPACAVFASNRRARVPRLTEDRFSSLPAFPYLSAPPLLEPPMAKKKTPASRRSLSLSTRSIHGRKLYAFQGPVALPIYQTSTYRFASSDDAIRFAKGDPSVYVYTRYHNPTEIGRAHV